MRLGKVDIVRSRTMRAIESPRGYLAARYLSGGGLEIGALNHPTLIPPHCQVLYADRLTTNGLKEQYPEIPANEIAEVNVVGNCERLDELPLPLAKLDFIIANHFLEHCQDPIGTIDGFAKVLCPGGKILMAIPHRLRTFDLGRSPSDANHFLSDHRDGGASTKVAHYREWVTKVEHLSGPEIDVRVDLLMNADYSIHFHVWTPTEFLQFAELCSRVLSRNFHLLACLDNDGEFIVVLELGN